LEAANLGSVVVDVLPCFNQQKGAFQLYWKTDTHWTFHGCFFAYQSLCDRLGVPTAPDIIRGKPCTGNIVLDLGAQLNPPRLEEFATFDFLRNSRRIATNPIVNYKEKNHMENDVGLHVGSNVIFVNRDPVVDKRVVLFGDSFSEYRAHLLTGMLAETFRELHFVWSSSLDWNYIERVRPDILLTELAERFMVRLPSDTFDLDTHVVSRLAPLMTSTPTT
jgi:alginate O-acetyltransferase complex protein AlgJ